jgi:hypothetical protein
LFEEYRSLYAPTKGTGVVEDTTVSKQSKGGMLKEVISKKLKMNNGKISTPSQNLINILLMIPRKEIQSLIFLLGGISMLIDIPSWLIWHVMCLLYPSQLLLQSRFLALVEVY